jgi:hypothetical protein
MIPIKIISRKEAERLGLTEKVRMENGKAKSIMAGIVVGGKEGEPGEVLERTIIQEGKNELLFMHEERKKQLNDKGDLEEYLDQFHIIEKMDKEEYFKKFNLKLKPKDLKIEENTDNIADLSEQDEKTN